MSEAISLNGEPVVIDEGTSVQQLIAERFGDRRWLAVAVDGEVVPRSRWAEAPIPAGANVEILTAVQGG